LVIIIVCDKIITESLRATEVCRCWSSSNLLF